MPKWNFLVSFFKEKKIIINSKRGTQSVGLIFTGKGEGRGNDEQIWDFLRFAPMVFVEKKKEKKSLQYPSVRNSVCKSNGERKKRRRLAKGWIEENNDTIDIYKHFPRHIIVSFAQKWPSVLMSARYIIFFFFSHKNRYTFTMGHCLLSNTARSFQMRRYWYF